MSVTHLYELDRSRPAALESVALDDVRLNLGHEGEHDLHLAHHGVASLQTGLIPIVSVANVKEVETSLSIRCIR